MLRIPTVILDMEASDEYSRGLIRGIVKYVRLHGPWNLQIKPPFYRQTGKLHRNELLADGIIAHIADVKRLRRIAKSKIPAIVEYIKKAVPDLPIIITDSKQIGEIAAKHLLDCGLKNFAFCGYGDFHWSDERQLSFGNEIIKAGFI